MARSAHAYVRGATQQFYQWLASSGNRLPQGPPVWICGDCHLGNLGPVANTEGQIEIEIRDLDQTVVGNPAHDLIRLGLSLATAARGSDLPGATTARMVERMIVGYEKALTGHSTGKAVDIAPIQKVLEQSYRRRWHHLAEERIEDVTPTIPLGPKFWALASKEREAIDALFATPEAQALANRVNQGDGLKVRVLDAAYWMKGCSSLGRLRYAVLLGVGPRRTQRHCLIDIKEAVAAAAPAAAATEATLAFGTLDYALRVVSGATALSPFLGERMLASTLLRRPVVLRELMPQDLKLEMDHLTARQAVDAAEFLAGVVGRAHARQMDKPTRQSWRRELAKGRTKSLEAPGWMWSSVVDLVGSHESAYLEHCRRYA